MRGISGWNYAPYRPYDRMDEAKKPFVCRLAPGEREINLEWFDKGSEGAHWIRWRKKDSDEVWSTRSAESCELTLSGLSENTDYELQIIREDDGAASGLRYVRTGAYPGTVVNYLHPEDKTYDFSGRFLCSPSLVQLPSGALLASMDLFAGDQPQNLTLVFRSDDRGATWHYVTELFPCYWTTLFWHQDKLFAQCCSTEYGDILIGCSEDEGRTWSKPERLFVGACSNRAAGWQRTPMPILRANGRLWVSTDYGAWAVGGHAICMLSIAEDADPMVSENWCMSELTHFDPTWPGAPEGVQGEPMLEGSMVVAPDGRLMDILRIGLGGCKPNHGVAVALQADWDDPEAAMQFHSFVALPSGSNSKTHIVQDKMDGKYYAIGNLCVDERTPNQRNVLALQCSEDLVNWRIIKILQDYRHEDPDQVGFQYISFLIDGDDILYLSRTAINGAENYHNANCQTFHVIENFRALAD